MLENSFVHLPGIGPETERKLWASGVRTWKDLESQLSEIFSAKKADQISSALEACREACESHEFNYFQGRLKGSEMWRLLPSLIERNLTDKIAFLDIETTGLGFPPESESTTIAVLFDGQLHVEHDSKKKYQLLYDIEHEAKLLVTFNGGPFDLPFLRRETKLSFSHAHVDLRFWFANLGYRGGLKNIQGSFSEIPQREFMDIDGFDAVRLWALHQRGVENALETLMTYNAEDTLVLEHLIYCGLNLEAEQRPHLNLQTYDLPEAREIKTRVCPEVYRMIRG